MWLWNNNVHNEAQNNLQETQKGCISLKYLYTGTLKTIKFLFGTNGKLMVLVSQCLIKCLNTGTPKPFFSIWNKWKKWF